MGQSRAHVLFKRFDRVGVGGPFPDVANKIVEPDGVRLKRF